MSTAAEDAVNRAWLERFASQMLADTGPAGACVSQDPVGRQETPRTGHPLGIAGRVLLGAALAGVGMGLAPGVSVAEPAPTDTTQSTSDSRPAPATNVRSMTDRELGQELGRVSGKDTLRTQEVVGEMKLRGQQFFEAAPPTRGAGVSGAVPVRPGVSATGTVAYDPNNGSVITSAGVRLGKPSAPQFTGIAPKPDGLNADAGGNVKLGKYGELSSKFSLNVAPDLSVSGSYKAKGTVTAPDGRSYEMEVSVERQADGTWNIKTPDGVTTGTPLPGGGSIDTKQSTDPTARPEQPELKGKAPETGPATGAGSWSDRFSFGAGVSVDKEFKTTPGAAPTKEEFDRAFADFAKAQSVQRQQVVDWKAVNRPEAVAREGLQAAEDSARAAEARGALPDLDRDGIPDEQDATPNQNDTDPTSTDVGDGPEGNAGYTGSTESGYSDSGFGDNTDSVDSGSGSFSGSLDSGSSGSSDSGSSSSYSDSGFGDSSGSVDSRAGYSDSGSSGGFDSGDGDSGGFGGDSGGF